MRRLKESYASSRNTNCPEDADSSRARTGKHDIEAEMKLAGLV